MYKKIKSAKFKRGFTLIELIVVIAVIAVLVLLAVPKFMGQTDKAKEAHIINDVRVVESKVGEYLIEHGDLTKWGAPIGALDGDELYNKRGLIDSDNPITGGPFRGVSEEVLDEVKSHLDGTFYSNDLGGVYYSKEEFIVDNEDIDEDDGQEPSEKRVLEQYLVDRFSKDPLTSRINYTLETDSKDVINRMEYAYVHLDAPGVNGYIYIPEEYNFIKEERINGHNYRKFSFSSQVIKEDLPGEYVQAIEQASIMETGTVIVSSDFEMFEGYTNTYFYREAELVGVTADNLPPSEVITVDVETRRTSYRIVTIDGVDFVEVFDEVIDVRPHIST